MKYVEKNFLCCRSATEQAEDAEIEPMLMGEKALAHWFENENGYGCDSTRIYPAFRRGSGRCFLIEREWVPAAGYSATGTEEEIVSFEDGVAMLCRHGRWNAFEVGNE